MLGLLIRDDSDFFYHVQFYCLRLRIGTAYLFCVILSGTMYCWGRVLNMEDDWPIEVVHDKSISRNVVRCNY